MKCKKLIYRNSNNVLSYGILLGLITKEENDLVYFKTAKRKYVFHKSMIVSIMETDQEFRGVWE
jgi:hypothetical protein